MIKMLKRCGELMADKTTLEVMGWIFCIFVLCLVALAMWLANKIGLGK